MTGSESWNRHLDIAAPQPNKLTSSLTSLTPSTFTPCGPRHLHPTTTLASILTLPSQLPSSNVSKSARPFPSLLDRLYVTFDKTDRGATVGTTSVRRVSSVSAAFASGLFGEGGGDAGGEREAWMLCDWTEMSMTLSPGAPEVRR